MQAEIAFVIFALFRVIRGLLLILPANLANERESMRLVYVIRRESCIATATLCLFLKVRAVSIDTLGSIDCQAAIDGGSERSRVGGDVHLRTPSALGFADR